MLYGMYLGNDMEVHGKTLSLYPISNIDLKLLHLSITFLIYKT